LPDYPSTAILLTTAVSTMRHGRDMARSERLLALVQMLRRHRHPLTAEAMARELGVSLRTVYRDVASLIASRVPIRGEAGLGYVLEPGFDLPPLMFTPDEVEAIVVGMRWLRERADPMLARAADDVVAKLGAVLPEALRPLLHDTGLFAPHFADLPGTISIDEASIRGAIRRERKVSIAYADGAGAQTVRTIWPFGLAFFNHAHVVMAWCETRAGFRHFRTDRISAVSLLAERYPERRAVLLRRWKTEVLAERTRGAQRA
jgi:predicted DNA-binding transcriptional regulator YafY